MSQRSTSELSPYFSRAEIMAAYKVSESTTRKWQREGLLVPIRVGGAVRFTAAAVASFDKYLSEGGAN